MVSLMFGVCYGWNVLRRECVMEGVRSRQCDGGSVTLGSVTEEV